MNNIQLISSDLQLSEDGIWYSKNSDEISYPETGHQSCFAVEDNSFWFKHRNNCITSIVKSYPPENNGTIFDIGGGNGFVSLGLVNAGFDVALVEPGPIGAKHAKQRGLKNVICATTDTAQFKQESLPAVGLFDVIEHIEDDVAFLKSIRNLISEDGRIYVTVPAYNFLWSAEDVSAGHFRRYDLKSINQLLVTTGFEVEFATYIFRFLPFPIFLLRALPFKIGLSKTKKEKNTSRDHAAKGGVISHFLNYMLRSEIKNINRKQPMRFGGSCLVVAKKYND